MKKRLPKISIQNGAHDIQSKRTYYGGDEETPRANPDTLLEDESMYHVDEITKEVQGRVTKLMKLAKQILTEQQYNVFVMLAVKEPHLTEREAAKVLSITPGRVHQLWDKARTKLEEAYEKRTA